MSNAPPSRSTHLIRWNNLYTQTELYRAAVRVYTKPLFHWRKALCTSTDGRTLYDFAANGLRGLDSLHRSLMRRQFQFRPAVALHYNFNGKHRTLYISPWEERIVDLLLYRALNRRLHSWFSDNSYAYREQGYALDVCQSRITAFLRAAGSPVYALKRDIADYFATVNHEILLSTLAELVDPEDYLFQLLEQRIRFRYEDNGEPRVAEQGIPFGTAIACLFANVYLTEFDRRLEGIHGVAYYRYADDILVLSRERQPALLAAEQLECSVAGLKLKLKASHRADLLLASESTEDQPFTSVREFRHLGLLFRSGGQVSLSRDKLRKIQNLFRFAFRRSRRRWRKITDPKARAQALVAVAAETLERGLRNVAIVDYYLKHVGDENQLGALDRWLAEEVLSQVFGGHKKGHFRRISFAQLRAMGLPSLVHRRRLIRRGRIESPFFIWQQEKTARAFRGTVARLHGLSSQAAFSSVPEAAAGTRP